MSRKRRRKKRKCSCGVHIWIQNILCTKDAKRVPAAVGGGGAVSGVDMQSGKC